MTPFLRHCTDEFVTPGITHVIMLLFDGYLLENDIIYIHHNNCGCSQCDVNNPINRIPAHWNRRILGSIYSSKMVSNQEYMLPYYRFWMMDVNCFGNLMLDRPSADTMSRNMMADSLRKILSLDFQRVLCVHHYDVMTADDFKQSVNQSWRWLDGKSLRMY